MRPSAGYNEAMRELEHRLFHGVASGAVEAIERAALRAEDGPQRLAVAQLAEAFAFRHGVQCRWTYEELRGGGLIR